MELSDIYQKASLVQIPSGYKSGTLYSVVPNTADGDFTVTGDPQGEATRVNKDGLIETVSANVPRLNYNFIDGVVQPDPHLLLEPTRLNYTAYSAQFDNSYWSKATSDSTPNPTVTANAGVSPDGGLNADRVQATAAPNNSWAVVKRDGINTGATVGSKLQQSLYLKAYDSRQIGKKVDIYIYDFSNSQYGTVYNYTLTDDWQRVVVEHTIAGSNTSTNIEFSFGKARNSAGGSTQSEAATDFLVWGAQLEAGSYPTSIIKTSGSAVTRTLDKCLNAGSSNLFNDTEGTLFVDLENFDAQARELTLSSGSADNRITLLFYGSTFASPNRIRFYLTSDGSVQADSLFAVSYTFNQRNKIAFRYKQNDFKGYLNGVQVFSDTIGNTPIGLSDFEFSDFNGTGGFIEGEIHQAMIFNEALTDAELIALTT